MLDSARAHILVVDDEPDLRALYELTLVREGHAVVCAGDIAQARRRLSQQRFDVLITDMRLPDGLGLELVRQLGFERCPEKSIVITAYGSAQNAVEALKSGAFDYLTKPVDLKQLRSVVQAALQSQHQAPRVASERMGGAGGAATGYQRSLDRIVGSSAYIVQVKQRIEKIASSMAPTLVWGESGTGKELVARAIHECSHRSKGPFVAVNCAAVPDNLIESEFFGAKKGAYTGAAQDREGYFQAAKGGTLFLDEIGDLPLAMQAKLLRAIQERRVRPLGGAQEELIDVRIVSATHRDLASMVQRGAFRQDLFYRLNVIELRTPALRQRRQDLPDIAQALLQRISADAGLQTTPAISPSALDWLQTQELPGNIRELENLLHRALALSSGQTLELADFIDTDSVNPTSPPAQSVCAEPVPADLQDYLDQHERQVLLKALQETAFNRTAAATRLGLNLRQMRYRIQRLGITIPASSDDAD